MRLATDVSAGGAWVARSGPWPRAPGGGGALPDEGRGPAGEIRRVEGTGSGDGGRNATGDGAVGGDVAGGVRPSGPEPWHGWRRGWRAETSDGRCLSVPPPEAGGRGLLILGVNASGVLRLWVTNVGVECVGRAGRVARIVRVWAVAFLTVEDATDFVEAVRVFEPLDLGEAAEDRFVEEPLAAGRSPLFGDQADGGVVVDGLPGDVEVVGDLGDAVEFARDAEDHVAPVVVARAADVPQVLGDGLQAEASRPFGGIAARVCRISHVQCLTHLAMSWPRMGVRGRKNGFDSLVKLLYRAVVKKNLRGFPSFFNAEIAETTERTQRTGPLRVTANGNGLRPRRARREQAIADFGLRNAD